MIFVGYFFAGVFLINGLPHFIQGVSGNPFQTPFASPPGVGESSAVINVLWGALNFGIAYGLLSWAGLFELGLNLATLSFISGGVLIAVILAVHFGKVRNT